MKDYKQSIIDFYAKEIEECNKGNRLNPESYILFCKRRITNYESKSKN